MLTNRKQLSWLRALLLRLVVHRANNNRRVEAFALERQRIDQLLLPIGRELVRMGDLLPVRPFFFRGQSLAIPACFDLGLGAVLLRLLEFTIVGEERANPVLIV